MEPDDVEVGLGMLDWMPQKRMASVDSLANKRAHLLASLCSNRLLEDTGRVVAFMPDQSLFDGAAEVETEGFFDRNNVLAWDTWICYVQDYLLAWVPHDLVQLVERGIWVNPEQCIMWAKDVDIPFLHHVAVHPLL